MAKHNGNGLKVFRAMELGAVATVACVLTYTFGPEMVGWGGLLVFLGAGLLTLLPVGEG